MSCVDQLREISQAHESALAAKDAEIAALKAALEMCADWVEDYYVEGDAPYQVSIIAREALKEKADG
jgi:hypothetical protein